MEKYDEETRLLMKHLNIRTCKDITYSLPSVLTTDAYGDFNEKIFKNDSQKNVNFNDLALCHSTLLQNRLMQKIYKPSKDIQSCDDKDAKKQIINCDSSDIMKIVSELPPDWTVVQVTSESSLQEQFQKVGEPPVNPTLYISRIVCGSNQLPLVKKLLPPRAEGKGVRSIVYELELIKQENKIISQDYKDDQEKYYIKRKELNSRLMSVVRSMELAWLKQWSCLFVGTLPISFQQQLDKIASKIIQKFSLKLDSYSTELFKLVISCPVIGKKNELSALGDCYPLCAAISSIFDKSVRSKIVKDVYKQVIEEAKSLLSLRDEVRNPLILILDKSVVSLPWEMITVMYGQPVTRAASIQSLALLYKHHMNKADSVLVNGVNPKQGFFLLDPDNNLKKSQERLQETFKQANWRGITAQRPSQSEFQAALLENDLFIYVGHGSGSQYLPGELVEGLDCKAAVFLYGCSSTKLAPRGRIPEPWGVVLNYIVANCPCVIGMLWEVTDKDTDLLTREMLRAILQLPIENEFLKEFADDIPMLVAHSRKLCTWYLTAAAITVYGLPLRVQQH